MADEQVIGSATETEGAIRKVPSLALSLFPRPELLAAGDSWLTSGADSEGVGDGKAQETVDPCGDSTGGG